MVNQDTAQKELLSFNDVFADVFNARVFQGEQIISPDSLEDARAEAGYSDEFNPLGEYERDVVKIWREKNVALAILGLENQNRLDPDMVFRMFAYDGLSYRAQMKRSKNTNERYPVISVVFNFAKSAWKKRLTLRESVVFPKDADGNSLEERMAPFFNDYKLNVVDVPRLSFEEIQLFRSDFKLIAGAYYALVNQGVPICDDVAIKVRHIEESLRCMREIFNAELAETVRKQINDHHGEVNMGVGMYLVDRLVNKGREEGKEIWLNKGREEGKEIWLNKGREEGKEIWLNKGREEGREEGSLLKARESALRMRAQNISVDQIALFLAVPPSLVQTWIRETQTAPK